MWFVSWPIRSYSRKALAKLYDPLAARLAALTALVCSLIRDYAIVYLGSNFFKVLEILTSACNPQRPHHPSSARGRIRPPRPRSAARHLPTVAHHPGAQEVPARACIPGAPLTAHPPPPTRTADRAVAHHSALCRALLRLRLLARGPNVPHPRRARRLARRQARRNRGEPPAALSSTRLASACSGQSRPSRMCACYPDCIRVEGGTNYCSARDSAWILPAESSHSMLSLPTRWPLPVAVAFASIESS
jgi:hypothetical protein